MCRQLDVPLDHLVVSSARGEITLADQCGNKQASATGMCHGVTNCNLSEIEHTQRSRRRRTSPAPCCTGG